MFLTNTKKREGYNGVEEIPTIVNIDFICKYISGDLTTSVESTDVKWFSKNEALELINPKLHFRFRKALDYQSAFTCMGFHRNPFNEIEVDEEYLFNR